MTGSVPSLAEISADEVVYVRRIFFGCLQERCDELGVSEGDLVSVAGATGSSLVLRTTDGRLVPCPSEVARFVEVRRRD
jgi:hypothetical protein